MADRLCRCLVSGAVAVPAGHECRHARSSPSVRPCRWTRLPVL